MSIFSQFIDIIYPPRCHICQKFLWKNGVKKDEEPIGFCQPCFDGFSEITSPLCPICGRPFLSEVEEDHLCEDCLRKKPVFDAVRAPYLYEGSLMTAIHQFKYAGKSSLANAFGPLLASFAKEWLIKADGWLMMPVPLHPKRLRERGFNQSLLLARQMSSRLDTDLDFLSLRRIRYTQPQTGLKIDQRRKNVHRAFEVRERKAVKGRIVLLVDDVATTGHTLKECARVLKRSGAEAVFCLVVARTLGS